MYYLPRHFKISYITIKLIGMKKSLLPFQDFKISYITIKRTMDFMENSVFTISKYLILLLNPAGIPSKAMTEEFQNILYYY